MNDTLALLLATSILATWGVGLYMFKPTDDNAFDDENYNEDNLFDDKYKDKEDDLDFEIYEPKARSRGGKTKRNRKGTGTKRRY